MLDTNIVSIGVRNDLFNHWIGLHYKESEQLCISSITKAELLYGLKKNPDAKKQAEAVTIFLGSIQTLPWNSDTSIVYADLRVAMERTGLSLSNMDMLIAAHAKSAGLTLVTNDRAFYQAKHLLQLADWSQA